MKLRKNHLPYHDNKDLKSLYESVGLSVFESGGGTNVLTK